MSLLNQNKSNLLNFINTHMGTIFIVLCLLIMAGSSFAGDVLSTTEGVVKDTYNGSIKTYLYIGEAVAAITTLIFTRNIKVLGAVGGVAIFFNIVALLAGV